MSVRQGNKIIAGQPASGVNLFDFKWADHQLDDMSWLRADTFSWHSGDVYIAAYEHLYSEYTEAGAYPNDNMFIDTVDGVSVIYWLTKDGHKICAHGQEPNVQAMYEKTGVAWYYLIDIYNKQFKLPRTKWGFVGLRGSLAAYIAAGVPNITGSVTRNLYSNTPTATGSFVQGSTSDTNIRNDGGGEPAGTLSFDASRSSPVYGNSNTVQPPATQMYLYFYVGNFEKEALKQTAGLNAELFNGKVDVDLGNIPANYDYVVESQSPTSSNGYTWYRKYKSGWVEQGGLITNATTYTLPVAMIDTNYYVNVCWDGGKSANFYPNDFRVRDLTTTSFFTTASRNGSNVQGRCWEVKGMAA